MTQPSSHSFAPNARFTANPDLYDYIHTLHVGPADVFEMIDGAGQQFFTVMQCHFATEALSDTAWRLTHSDLVELNPYYMLKRVRGLEPDARYKSLLGPLPYEDGDVRSRPEPMRLQVTQEAGPFVLQQHIVWNLEDEQDWPHFLFRERYHFSIDPLDSFKVNRSPTVYNHFFPDGSAEPDTRVYYRMQDAERLTARELAQHGIATLFDGQGWAPAS